MKKFTIKIGDNEEIVISGKASVTFGESLTILLEMGIAAGIVTDFSAKLNGKDLLNVKKEVEENSFSA